MLFKFRNKKIFIASFLICFIIIVLSLNQSQDEFYYDEEGGLLSVLDNSFKPGPFSIYFHETSNKGGLDSRQACAVEAAARAHPKWQIYVLIVSPVKNLNQTSFKALEGYKNINFYRINLLSYSEGTPLKSLLVSGALSKSQYRISHTSDFLRYLTLFKWGGIYLDLDTIVVRNLEPLGFNWAAKEADTAVAAGALAFSMDATGRTVAEAAAYHLANDFRGDDWGHNGPGVITRVLQELCHTTDVKDIPVDNCNGFKVFGPEVMYPIYWKSAYTYFKPQEENYTKTYIHHIWNQVTKSKIVPKGSLYDSLAKEYCPNVYYAYIDNFGL